MEEKRGGVPKRNKQQKFEDFNFIIPLFLKGRRFAEITNDLQAVREYPVDYKMVYRDIQTVLKDWRAERLQMIDSQMDVDLKKIDRLEAIYWESWEKRCQAKVKTVAKERSIYDKKKKQRIGDITNQQAERHVTETVGDKQWLEGIQWCITERSKILQYSKIVQIPNDDDNPAVGELVFMTRSRKNNSQFTDAIEVQDEDSNGIQKLLQS